MMSGLAAAERLGADYPFSHDKLAAAQVGSGAGWVQSGLNSCVDNSMEGMASERGGQGHAACL